jgi:hypothetical protein
MLGSVLKSSIAGLGFVQLVEDDLLNPVLVLLPLDVLRPLPLQVAVSAPPFCFQLRLHVAGGSLQQQRRMKKCDLWCAVLLLTITTSAENQAQILALNYAPLIELKPSTFLNIMEAK